MVIQDAAKAIIQNSKKMNAWESVFGAAVKLLDGAQKRQPNSSISK